MVEMLSDEVIMQRMHQFLLANFVAKEKSVRRGELRGIAGGREIVIIAPVSQTQKPALEEKIKTNSKNGLATAIVFPKSCRSYQGHYCRYAGIDKYFLNKREVVHSSVNLSTVEQYLLRVFGNPVYYFHPVRSSIGSVDFRRHPDWYIARLLELEPESEKDKPLLDRARQLKRMCGKGYLDYMGKQARSRYIELRRIEETRETRRMNGRYVEITNGAFTLEVCEGKRGLLTARIVPYQTGQQLEFDLGIE